MQLMGVLALIGPYSEAYRGYKIRITEDGRLDDQAFSAQRKGISQEVQV